MHHNNDDEFVEGDNSRDKLIIESEDRDIEDKHDDVEDEDENGHEDNDDENNEEHSSDEGGDSYSENGDLTSFCD